MGRRGGLSLLFGAIIGAITALLFAPGKGKDLRKKVKNEVEKGGAGLQSVGGEIRKMCVDMKESFNEWLETDEVKDALNKGKKKIEDIAIKGQEVIENFKKNSEGVVEEVKKNIKQTSKTGKKNV